MKTASTDVSHYWREKNSEGNLFWQEVWPKGKGDRDGSILGYHTLALPEPPWAPLKSTIWIIVVVVVLRIGDWQKELPPPSYLPEPAWAPLRRTIWVGSAPRTPFMQVVWNKGREGIWNKLTLQNRSDAVGYLSWIHHFKECEVGLDRNRRSDLYKW